MTEIEPKSLIQFSKIQTGVSCKYLMRVMAKLAEIEEAMHLIDDLSIVLSVMWKCHEAAPDIPNFPPEAAKKSKKKDVVDTEQSSF